MSLELLENLIRDDFGYSYTGNWGKTETHSSFVIDREHAIWYWNSRGLRGNLTDYLRTIRGYSEEQIKEYINNSYSVYIREDKAEGVSKPYDKLVEFLWRNGIHSRSYWYKRGLTDLSIDRFKLGYSDEWYTIPFYEGGVFKNFQCRKDEPEKKIKNWYKGVGPILFNPDILNFVSSVFITEGPVDAILLMQNGFSAISHNGGATGWKSDWIRNFVRTKEITYIADNDDVGIKGAAKVAKCLGESRVKIYRFRDKPEKYDTVDFFRDSGTVDEFKERIKSAVYLCEGV